jgi:hypothetical protein
MTYLLGYGGSTVPASLAAPYLSWAANPSESNLAQVEAANINAYVYTDGVIEYPCSGCSHLWAPLQSNPQYIAKDCSGNILHNGAGDYVDVTQAGWFTFWSTDVENEYSRVSPSAWTAVFADDSGAPHFKGTIPCGTTVSSFTDGIYNLLSSTLRPVIFNGLSVTAKQPEERTLYGVPNVIGGMREDCYGGNGGFGFSGDFVMTTAQHFYGAATDEWTQAENDQLYAASQRKLFFCLSNATDSAASSIGARTYIYASFLLTYDAATSALFEEFSPSTGGGLGVYPETGLVPTEPLIAAPSSVSSLAVGGVYAREYNACFYRGAYKGPCAVVVNPTNSSQAYPFGSKYNHTLTLSGGGVLEGGTVSTSGPPPPSSLGGASALIAFQ